MKYLILPIVLSLFIGCVQNGETKPKAKNEKEPAEENKALPKVKELDLTIELGKRFEIAELGICHGDEFSEELAKLQWQGLFYDSLSESYTLHPVNLKTERVFDGILDGEGEKTGWNLFTLDDTQPFLVVSGFSVKNAVEIDAIELSKRSFLMGESIDFKFLHVDYRLKGFSRDSFVEEYQTTESRDFRLELSNLSQYQNQVLTASDFVNLTIPHIVFSGDLDQDGKLDLIIDCSTHYNIWGYSVFLSSKAKPTEILGLVTESYRSGC